MTQSRYDHLATPDSEWVALSAKTPYIHPVNDIRIARERVVKEFISVNKEHFRPFLPHGTHSSLVQ